MFRRNLLKTEEQIEGIRESCQILSQTFRELSRYIRPGTSTLRLDAIAEAFIRDHGALPAFKNYHPSWAPYPFPGSICASVNDVVVHGLPRAEDILQEGDLISVDCGVQWKGYFSDAAYTFAVGDVKPALLRLLHVTREALYLGIEKAVHGFYLGDLSHAIQRHVEHHGFCIVKTHTGHGIGCELHEAPEILNYGKPRQGLYLRTGLVIAVEPIVNFGKPGVEKMEDGWTIRTADRLPAAHFEHTLVVRKGCAEILTSFDFI